ncbi:MULTISPECIES: hypothetical protein [unclassified Sulfitobacter]|uniref:hypothetical protein n=1 Tax=unclassified Sulfitobacter TaxID=196795 RepID=UPI00374730EA
MKSNLQDIEVIFQHATERAVCVRADEDSDDTWIPLSQCEIDGDRVRGGIITLTAPQSILEERGLV